MYDMYPEWGPAAHDPKHPMSPASQAGHRRHCRWDTQVLTAPDLRDAGDERPEDN